MPVPRRSLQGEWSSHGLFILALAGASIGFGNLWRFPMLVAEHGGGAFILLYLCALLLLGIPLLLVETVIGRGAHQAPVQAFGALARLHGKSRAWVLAGGLALIGALLLLSTLAVVASWAMGYLFRTLGGAAERMDIIDAMARFRAVTSDPERSLAWLTVFLAMVMATVMLGLRKGIEPFVRLVIPLLLLAVLLLAGMVLARPEAADTFHRVFAVDFAYINGETAGMALRQAFYSLVLGAGVATAFGAYLPERIPLVSATVMVALLDLLVALAGSVIVLALLAAGGEEVHAGSALVFETLPRVFSVIGGGHVMAVLLYVILILGALATAVALMEPVVAWLSERGRMRRQGATLVTGVLVWMVGIASILSVAGQGWYPLSTLFGSGDVTLLHLLNRLATLIVLPAASLAALVFVGWVLPRESLVFGLGWREGWPGGVVHFVIRFVTPLLLLFVLLDGLGVMDVVKG